MKFAYLIMAHDNPNQLITLLKLLDDEKNDIYLHIDKKNKKMSTIRWEKYSKRAKLNYYCKYKVYWGDISQTKTQMFLLRKSLESHHDYYHLISGKDLPIKSNSYIQKFFSMNNGKEFVFFEDKNYCNKESSMFYHFFYYGKYFFLEKIFIFFEKISLLIQKKIKIRRQFFCGDNWYSITEKLAADFSKNEKKMLKIVRYSNNSDELILQTFLYPRLNKYNLYYDGFDENPLANVRQIDWIRGNPYTWRSIDFEYLRNSNFLFARKFDEKVDNKIIQMIEAYIHENCNAQ